jgi:hypothetical protein
MLVRNQTISYSENPASDAIAGFEDAHRCATFLQFGGGSKAGQPRPHDGNGPTSEMRFIDHAHDLRFVIMNL